MAKTLLQLCQGALEGFDGVDVPETIIGNSDLTAVLLKAAAKQVGKELARKNWQALITAGTITTVSGTSQYAIPAGFKRFANDTFYNVSEYQQMYGPYTPRTWAELTRGIALSTVQYSFRVAANYIELYPTPSSVQTIGYDYYSRYYCTTSGGTAQEEWTADTDLNRLDDDLFMLGIRYRVAKAKGLPFAEDKADYLQAIDDEIWDDTPKQAVDVSGVPRQATSNIPDSNWG